LELISQLLQRQLVSEQLFFFLAVLALFQDKRKIKYVFLAGVIFSLVLSWGKNFRFS
jgi:hypothetical protein